MSGDLENFAILLSTTDSDLIKAQADAGDILFMDETGVAKKIYHDIESYNQASGSLISWINLPNLSSNENTTFYLYYGNPECANQQRPEKTWNTNFKAVWHLNNNPTGTILDSTLNHNYGTSHGGMTQSDLIDGKIGKCLHFDGSDDFIALSYALVGQSGTIEAWINTNTEGEYKGILTKGQSYSNNAYFMFCILENGVGFYSRAVGYGEANKVRSNTNVLSTWHHVVGISSGSLWSVYVDGQLESLVVTGGSNNGEWFNSFTGDTYSIGALNRPGNGGFFNGYIDEIRVSSSIENLSWISTEFNNQNNPSNFLAIGPEESGP